MAEKVCCKEMVKMSLVELKVLEVYTKSNKEHESRLKMNLELLKKEKCKTDDLSERTFRTLENMFRACVRNLVVVRILTFREMSFPTKIVVIRVFDVFSLEALYGRKCRSSMLWAEIRKSSLIGPELVLKTTDKVCLADAILHVPLDEIKVDKILHFVEELVEIMEREIRKLKRKLIALVKVRWNSKRGPEFTWEHEDQKRIKRGYCDNRGLSHLVILDDDLDHKIDIMVNEAPWLCDQLESLMWYAPWLCDQLESFMWYPSWLCDQLESFMWNDPWLCDQLELF
uniref:Putative reverse transcriptase domain-containing protein n=1 Tax=Tanacetum cinerariifolium TaxID=118510 RepID=A0A699HYK5_TANCI|nr:putative reverse transcriptase domain-containing protein [Tanacetum cinerariifolium]